MRILFLSPAAHLGGAERVLLDLIASIREHAPGTEMRLVSAAEGPMLAQAECLGARVLLLPFGKRFASIGDSHFLNNELPKLGRFARKAVAASFEAAAYARKLRAAIDDFGPDIVHSNGIKMHVLAAAARGSAPLVWHVHDFIGVRPVMSWALWACAWRADVAIANSSAVADDIRRVVGNIPVTTILNAVDTEVFSPEGDTADLDALASRSASPPKMLRIGLVATYARWKGHDVFLDAIRVLRSLRGGHELRFYIVGGPIYAPEGSQFRVEELRDRARHLGIEDDVCFVPFQTRVQSVYRALDVVVHASSRPEPFGRTIAEAMATGRPVIVTQEGGARELFIDGVEAIGIAPRDPTALASAISELTGDAERRRRLGIAARAAALTRFSRHRLAPQAFGVYRDARKRRGSADKATSEQASETRLH